MSSGGGPDLADLEREIRTLIEGRILDGISLAPAAPLDEAGVDSMAVIQILLLIEKRFGVWLPESDVTRENLKTVQSLARVLRRRLAEQSSAA
ncbi:MAG: acyl carrier protein [Deltaproteobacteria bacterium]|nr:acyl carrier protein [Deltaproteobacteria bacterium]